MANLATIDIAACSALAQQQLGWNRKLDEKGSNE